ncbi:MAG: D-alanyl-D-alanine carboxypeptidase precursor [Ignavibacteria bacterium]|nr:D-alanyl-D-alanine carboxypeptidase precursor [Ignavibacteria bacterium]
MKRLLVSITTILVLSLSFISCSKDSTPVQPSQNKILTTVVKAQLDSIADLCFGEVSTPGMMALISVEGEGDYLIKRGVSNRETGELMNENHFLRIASNTKPFTGAAVLILVDEGKINLDSSISYYLPEYKVPNGYKITIRMLGNMTSGLFSYSGDAGFWNSYVASNHSKTFPPDSLCAMAFRHPVNFEPGAKYDYCNTNTVLLGLLMEKVTGMSAKNVISEKLLKPLKLTNTYWPNSIFLQSPYLHGYSLIEGSIIEATNWNPSWGYTAGILVSTLWDMKTWGKALGEGKLLSEKMKSERFKWVEDHYGFSVSKAGDWVGHAGTMPGFNSHIYYNQAKKITLVVVCNMDTDTPVEGFSYFFQKILSEAAK